MHVPARSPIAGSHAVELRAHEPEFLLVCDDANIFENVSEAVKLVQGRLNCAGNSAAAADYITRRKVDGLVVDMGLSGALDLIRQARQVSSNRLSVVFACSDAVADGQFAIRAGANFILHRPLLAEKVAHIFSVAAGMMVSEKRRYFRYPLMVPVQLKAGDRNIEATMANLSEGGMAVWSLFYQIPGSAVEFAFEIPFAGVIRGRGEVAWTNGDGLAGIKFHLLPDNAYAQLSEWIARRDRKGV